MHTDHDLNFSTRCDALSRFLICCQQRPRRASVAFSVIDVSGSKQRSGSSSSKCVSLNSARCIDHITVQMTRDRSQIQNSQSISGMSDTNSNKNTQKILMMSTVISITIKRFIPEKPENVTRVSVPQSTL